MNSTLKKYFSTYNSIVVSKITQRSFIIILSGINTIATPLSNILLSFTVIYFTSSELWGSMVYIFLTFNFAFNIISWGNRPFLLQEFSLSPHNETQLWRSSFIWRSTLLFIFSCFLLFMDYTLKLKLYLIVWAIARYIYQSFESLIQYRRDFKFALISELMAICILLIPILILRQELRLEMLILLYTISFFVKSIAAMFFYRALLPDIPFLKTLLKDNLSSYKNYLITSFPFLLLTFTGMLQSRMDLYCVAYFLDKESVAKYQIYLGFLNFAQVTGSMILNPFSKNIFRMSKKSLRRLERLFISVGLLISFLLIILIQYILNNIYLFNFSPYAYLLGYFYIQCSYLYLLKSYELGKQRKQNLVAIFSLLSAIVSCSLAFILIPYVGAEGALASSISSQLLLLFLYYKVDYLESFKNYFLFANKNQ